MLNHRRKLIETISKEVKPVIEAMDIIPVEIRAGKAKNYTNISIIIHKASGVSVADCAAVSKNIYPRLEMIDELGDFRLEISSPGTGRILKERAEYNIFKGRPVAVLLHNASEWKNGIIDHVNKESLFLSVNGKMIKINFSDIKRTKLDFLKEEEE